MKAAGLCALLTDTAVVRGARGCPVVCALHPLRAQCIHPHLPMRLPLSFSLQVLMDAEGKVVSSTVLRGVNVPSMGEGSSVVVGNWEVRGRGVREGRRAPTGLCEGIWCWLMRRHAVKGSHCGLLQAMLPLIGGQHLFRRVPPFHVATSRWRCRSPWTPTSSSENGEG